MKHTNSRKPQNSNTHHKSDIQDIITEIIGQHFRPEFINRVDEVVVFHPLSADINTQIVKIQLDELSARIAKEKDIIVTYDADVLEYIMNR